jgi:formylglycine-generating enzyme required for sulfatase activity
VYRGGGFVDVARDARSAYRCGFDPSYRYNDLGFRPAQGIEK